MQEPSVFTRIINGEIPSYKIYEDDRVISFMALNPVADGHVLVVPKRQIPQVWDLDDDNFIYLWQTAQKIAKHLRTVMHTDRVGVVVKGFEVPHTHIHLIPVNFHSGISFDPEPSPAAASAEYLSTMAEKLKM